MNKAVMTAAAVAALSGAAFANEYSADMLDLRAAGFSASDRGTEELTQDFNNFPAGAFTSPTEGWSTNNDAAFGVTTGLDGTPAVIYQSNAGDPEILLSPTDPTPVLGVISADLAFSDATSAQYGFSPEAPIVSGQAGGFIITRVLFTAAGGLDVLQLDPVSGGGVFIDSGLTWLPGENNNVAVNLGADGSFTVSNNGLASSTTFTDISFAITGTLTPGFSRLGINAFDAAVGGTAIIDNVNVIPAPGAIALLGAAGLAGARRRR